MEAVREGRSFVKHGMDIAVRLGMDLKGPLRGRRKTNTRRRSGRGRLSYVGLTIHRVGRTFLSNTFVFAWGKNRVRQARKEPFHKKKKGLHVYNRKRRKRKCEGNRVDGQNKMKNRIACVPEERGSSTRFSVHSRSSQKQHREGVGTNRNNRRKKHSQVRIWQLS